MTELIKTMVAEQRYDQNEMMHGDDIHRQQVDIADVRATHLDKLI